VRFYIFLKKKYKKREGEYEQIFWRMEKLIREKPIKARLSTYLREKLDIVVDTNERYSLKKKVLLLMEMFVWN